MCSQQPVTGFYRDGYCRTDANDHGTHTVCAQVTDEFLKYSKSKGNDLITSNGDSFPGLVEGDHWCLCVVRWHEAYEAGKAPLVDLVASSAAALGVVGLENLQEL